METALSAMLEVGQQQEYTFIGDTVNVASRIRSLCKEQNTSLIIYRDLSDRIIHAELAEPLNQQSIIGKRRKVDLVKIHLP